MVLLIHQGKVAAMVVKDSRLSFFFATPVHIDHSLHFCIYCAWFTTEYGLTHLQLPAFELDSRDFHQIRARSLHYGLKKEPESKFADNWQKQISVSHKKSPIHICCTFQSNKASWLHREILGC